MCLRTGIEELRRVVRNFGDCNENFNSRFTVDELLQIHRMWMVSGWDIYPDHWTRRQVAEALAGKPPHWDSDTERPVYESGPTSPLYSFDEGEPVGLAAFKAANFEDESLGEMVRELSDMLIGEEAYIGMALAKRVA